MSAKRIQVTHGQIVSAEAVRVVDDVQAARRVLHDKKAEPKQIVEDLLAKTDIEVAGRVIGGLAAKRDPYARDLLRELSTQTPPAANGQPMPSPRGGRPATPPAAPDARTPFRASSGRPNPNTGRQRR